MTIQEALAQAMEIFPEGEITVSIEQKMKARSRWPFIPKNDDTTVYMERWIHHRDLPSGCISSTRSWEHALAIARSGNEDIWPEVEDEVGEVSQ